MGMRRLGALALALAIVSACSGQGNVFDLSVGACFDDPELVDGRVFDVETVECNEPHDNEVFAVVTLTQEQFPGIAEISRIADDVCLGHFGEFVGTPYIDSDLFASYISPSAGSWQAGDRTIVCYLFAPDEQLIGTAQGSNA